VQAHDVSPKVVAVGSEPDGLGPQVAFTERSVGGRLVARPRRLSGGVASEVYAMRLHFDGREDRVIVRRYVDGKGAEPGPPTIRRDVATLTQLDQTSLPVPRLLGADLTGETAGWPALVMTSLPGRIDLRPANPTAWTDALAETLSEIHEVDINAPPYEPRFHSASTEVPEWTRNPELWRAAIDAVSSSPPSDAPRFVHGDYQHFNVLWQRGRISGVLDGTGSWTGPRDVDVAHARLNLVCLFDVGLAESFRHAYEARAGRSTSAWRDVAELLGFAPRFSETLRLQIGRRARLDVARMASRVEELLALSVRRL
jgi:aminoglycoside phosphotransferase (APT) family kinase protein